MKPLIVIGTLLISYVTNCYAETTGETLDRTIESIEKLLDEAHQSSLDYWDKWEKNLQSVKESYVPQRMQSFADELVKGAADIYMNTDEKLSPIVTCKMLETLHKKSDLVAEDRRLIELIAINNCP